MAYASCEMMFLLVRLMENEMTLNWKNYNKTLKHLKNILSGIYSFLST